jgi:hypothetical protein
MTMRIPRYWTKASYTGRDDRGKSLTCHAWGWSFEDADQAREDAASRARRIFDRLINGARPDKYAYSARPTREEIVNTVRHGDKDIAIITRNRYGALVLNAASVLFVDIDYPRISSQGLWDALALVFSRSRRERRQAAARELTLASVRQWSERHAGHAFRVYRTCAGLRLLFVDGLYEPLSDQTRRILAELGSDPLYCTLTRAQECFRARLTPKPWRCGSRNPPNQYPWPDSRAEHSYRDWERRYEKAAEQYRVCDLVETCGTAAHNDEIVTVLALHDEVACDQADKELA